MRLRKAIKKIVALGTGTTMIGATLLGASAANLSDYPSPFVKDGVFNGKIVVGAQAAARDVVGSIEIATSLQTQSVTTQTVTTGGTGATTTLIGDSFKVDKSTDRLNMYQLLSGVTSVITGDDLNALEDGSISNNKGTFRYTQHLDIPENASVVYAVDTDTSDDPGVYLKFEDNYKVYTYKVSFPTALKTEINTAGEFRDLTNKKITLLGTEYTIIDTDNVTGEIQLMGGAIQTTMQEYTKQTFNLNGKDYEIEVIAISSAVEPEIIMKVNGEVTDKRVAGETIRLSDGTEIGIRSLLQNEGLGSAGADLVTFYLGASKVILKDSNFASGNTDGTLTIGTQVISDVMVDIHGLRDTGNKEASIANIQISWTVQDDHYVPLGGMLSEQLSGNDKDKLFLRNLDFKFAALQQGSSRNIVVQNSGSDRYKVTFPTKTGGTISEEFFYSADSSANGGNVSLGRDTGRNLIIDPAVNISRNDRFLVSSNKFSHLLEVGSFSTSDNKVTFKNLGTGESFDVSVLGGTGSIILGTDQYDFTAYLADQKINMDDFGTDGNGVAYTPEEYKLTFGTVDGNSRYGWLIIQEYEKQDDSTSMDTIQVTVVKADTSTRLNIGNVNSSDANFNFFSWDSKSDYATAYTTYGTHAIWDTSGTQDTVTLHVGNEAYAEVFITSGVVQVGSGGSVTAPGDVTTTTVNDIPVGSAVLDTEVSDVTADNYISIGGPCANSVSARLVGVAQRIPECLDGLALSEGQGVIKLFENGNKVSMLVAGATALDSHRASRVVAEYNRYPEFTGMEVSVTGTSLTDITVSAPAPAPAPAPADEE